MVIAEVLNTIKDLEKRRRELHGKIREDIYILPDLQVEEKPDTIEVQVAELRNITEQIADLKIRLMTANLTNTVEIMNIGFTAMETVSLMQAIKRMETYRYYESQYSEIANTMDNKSSRFFAKGGGYMSQGEPVKLAPNFIVSVKDMRSTSQRFREAARNVEQTIAKKNWQTEVV